MASKKEHRRRQKARKRQTNPKDQRSCRSHIAQEINSLNVLAPEDAPVPPGTEPDADDGREGMETAAVAAPVPEPEPEAEPREEERGGQAATEETKRLEVLEAERIREAAAAEQARRSVEDAEEAQKLADVMEQMREATLRERTGAEGDREERDVTPIPRHYYTAPAPLEMANPYWERSHDVFATLSGAPRVFGQYEWARVGDREAEQVLPVTMAGADRERETFEMPDEIDDDTQVVFSTVPKPPEERMYIVMITPEVAPCAKVGGLGDVILGLGRELMKRGHGVEVICPMYSGMRYDLINDLKEEYAELWSPHHNEWRPEKVFQGKVEGDLQVNFISGGAYTERDSIYGYQDDLQRFTYFSRQALEFMFKTNRRPDIIHCHDWATGLVPAILWDIYQPLGWNNSRVVYTIHNNESQGLCGFGDKLLSLVGLDVRNYMRPDRMQDDVHPGCINMMKAGIVYSNFVTTVSPTYAGELKTAIGGRGLQQTITRQSAKIGGVLNGIDYDSWNPQTDTKLAANYSVGNDFHRKYDNKKALRDWLGMNDAWKPIVAVVTRLTQQKGLDLIKAGISQTLDLQGQFVLLGSAPDPKVNADFLKLRHELKDNHDVSLYIGYHEDLSHLIYAGSDLFLIPSLYEPCGLTQMISLRYGTVPIVRETGGLLDTVFDLDNSGRGLGEANGFTFREPTPQSLHYGIKRAIRLWYDNPEAFNRLAHNGMRYDYSWRNPAGHYENIYQYIKA